MASYVLDAIKRSKSPLQLHGIDIGQGWQYYGEVSPASLVPHGFGVASCEKLMFMSKFENMPKGISTFIDKANHTILTTNDAQLFLLRESLEHDIIPSRQMFEEEKILYHKLKQIIPFNACFHEDKQIVLGSLPDIPEFNGYFGTMKDHKKHGLGFERQGNLVFLGEFKADKAYGYGFHLVIDTVSRKLVKSNGSLFMVDYLHQGYFKENSPEGQGKTYILNNLPSSARKTVETHEGMYHKGLKTASCTLTWYDRTSGTKNNLTAEYKEGKKQGIGKFNFQQFLHLKATFAHDNPRNFQRILRPNQEEKKVLRRSSSLPFVRALKNLPTSRNLASARS